MLGIQNQTKIPNKKTKNLKKKKKKKSKKVRIWSFMNVEGKNFTG